MKKITDINFITPGTVCTNLIVREVKFENYRQESGLL